MRDTMPLPATIESRVAQQSSNYLSSSPLPHRRYNGRWVDADPLVYWGHIIFTKIPERYAREG